MNVPEDLRYSTDHEWVRRHDDTARVGITDYAQDALGDVVFVQLPTIGTTVTAGERCSEVESTKSVSDIYAPVSGTVIAVNEAVEADPSLINSDPYGEGWIYEVRLSDPSEYDQLLDAAAYTQLTEG